MPQEPNVVVTDGSNNIKWLIEGFSGETQTLSPSIVVDTTGAGDSFLSGLIYKLISTSEKFYNLKELNNIIQFAAACGALVCSGEGAIDCQPNCADVKTFYSSLPF